MSRWSVDTGLPDAARRLAVLLDPGAEDVKPDWRRAVALYEYAILHGDDMTALDNLVDLYWEGRVGLPADPVKGVKLCERYEQSIPKSRSSNTNTHLGLLFAEGDDGFLKDIQQAIRLYEKAIELDAENTAALTNLGNLLTDGAGVPRDPKSAEMYFSKAADLGDSKANWALALLVRYGDEGFQVDKFRATKLCDDISEDTTDPLLTKLYVATILVMSEDDLGSSWLRAAQILEEILVVAPEEEVFGGPLQRYASELLAILLPDGGAGLDADRHRAFALFEHAI